MPFTSAEKRKAQPACCPSAAEQFPTMYEWTGILWGQYTYYKPCGDIEIKLQEIYEVNWYFIHCVAKASDID